MRRRSWLPREQKEYRIRERRGEAAGQWGATRWTELLWLRRCILDCTPGKVVPVIMQLGDFRQNLTKAPLLQEQKRFEKAVHITHTDHETSL